MLKTQDLTKLYGSFLALDNLTLEIESGKLHGFVGPNGAGKSTLLQVMACLLP